MAPTDRYKLVCWIVSISIRECYSINFVVWQISTWDRELSIFDDHFLCLQFDFYTAGKVHETANAPLRQYNHSDPKKTVQFLQLYRKNHIRYPVRPYPFFQILLLASYCGCFAMCFVQFAVHFIYRYYVACQPDKLSYFRGRNYFYWIFGMFSVALSWVAVAYFFFQEDEETQRDLEFVLSTCYNLRIEDVGYVPYAFYRTMNFEKVLRLDNMFGVIHHLSVMQISLIAVFYFGIKTYRKIILVKGKSQRTRDLQHQFFTALVVQTTIPLIFMFIPNSVLTVAAFVDGTFGAWANVTVVNNHLYPAADPFVILFIIRGFRNTIKNFICCGRGSSSITAVTSVNDAHKKPDRRYSYSSVIY